MPLTVVDGPAEEPVSLDEVANHLRIATDDVDDTTLSQYISAVRRNLEEVGGFALVTQTLEWSQDYFPVWTRQNPHAAIRLPRPPLQSVTSITYIDSTGSPLVMDPADYTVDTRPVPGQVFPAYGLVWPSARWTPNSVIVRYVAGYAGVGAVPEDYRQMVLVAAGELFEYREAMVDGGAPQSTGVLTRLMGPRRVWVTA